MIEPVNKHIHTQNYLEHHAKWRNDSLAWTREGSPTNYQTQFKFFTNLKRNKEFFAILDGKTYVGTTGLTGISPEHKTAEFSLLIGKEHRRKGHATQALKDILNYGFNNLGLNLIYGETFAYPAHAKKFLDTNKIDYIETDDGLVNPGATVYEKLGFQMDAFLPQRYIKHDFKVGSLIYSITKQEYERRYQ